MRIFTQDNEFEDVMCDDLADSDGGDGSDQRWRFTAPLSAPGSNAHHHAAALDHSSLQINAQAVPLRIERETATYPKHHDINTGADLNAVFRQLTA